MSPVFDVTPLPLAHWQDAFKALPLPNLLQSYAYARAVALTDRLRPEWATIRQGGEIIGMVQVFTAGLLGNALHAVIIDRGPLWMPMADTPENHLWFWAEMNARTPRRLGRRRRFIPEASADRLDPAQLAGCGLHRQGAIQPYQTIWVDTALDPATLRAQLRSNWRNHLNNAETQGNQAMIVTDRTELIRLVAVMDTDRRTRGYRGADRALLAALVHEASQDQSVFASSVRSASGDLLAAGLFFTHGRSATWQAGVVTALGRTANANYLMLWHAIAHLRERGVTALDLGGVNDEDARGVRDFKAGLNGEHITLVGQYC